MSPLRSDIAAIMDSTKSRIEKCLHILHVYNLSPNGPLTVIFAALVLLHYMRHKVEYTTEQPPNDTAMNLLLSSCKVCIENANINDSLCILVHMIEDQCALWMITHSVEQATPSIGDSATVPLLLVRSQKRNG